MTDDMNEPALKQKRQLGANITLLALAQGRRRRRRHDSAALWMPTSILKHPDGTTSHWPQIILDRAERGLLAVSKAGKRFANEINSYHDFVMGMPESNKTVPTVPAYLICDASFMKDYGVGLVFPGAPGLL